MTFKKVLKVFHDFLESDPMYEVITTSHGYALMEWDETQEDWNNCWHLATPEIMLERLLDAYEMFLMWKTLRGTDREELTSDEQNVIDEQCQQMQEKCEND